ncbi:hypothetical protein, conserved [Eimeria tenella]|uniref:Uncharacterized protein n=1 Tax=Eimeria tenella TaxID=5802 RepID=U6KGE4_EIMTE|nr:hypothetical protein, conserved [Eimeria tenella]CDJ37115.1 hypothetical protein, conserved [Eimeria tenella]|eukprot:XP_013227953.1 hypothetical protein, conserved [Eimeria tenella]
MLLSKGGDFSSLPASHPARLHAEAAAAKRRTFQLLLLGFLLLAVYLLSYFYQSWGAGAKTHRERHAAALSRLGGPPGAPPGAPQGAPGWVLAWRLWPGLVLGALLSFCCCMHRLAFAVRKQQYPFPEGLVAHWELLLGAPLLLLLLATGALTRPVAPEAAAAFAGAPRLLQLLLVHSGAASPYFLLDALLQVPWGLLAIGLSRLLLLLLQRLRAGPRPQPRSKQQQQQQQQQQRARRPEEDASSSCCGAEPAELQEEDSRRQGSYRNRRKSRRERGPRGPREGPPGGPRGPREGPPGGPRGPKKYPPHVSVSTSEDPNGSANEDLTTTPQSSFRTRRSGRERRRSRRPAAKPAPDPEPSARFSGEPALPNPEMQQNIQKRNKFDAESSQNDPDSAAPPPPDHPH